MSWRTAEQLETRSSEMAQTFAMSSMTSRLAAPAKARVSRAQVLVLLQKQPLCIRDVKLL